MVLKAISTFVALLLVALSASAEEPAEIDFAACKPTVLGWDGRLGSTTAQLVGPSRHGCVMLLGSEIENPRWDGFLDRTCIVPASFGQFQVERSPTVGADFSALNDYCVETPKKLRGGDAGEPATEANGS